VTYFVISILRRDLCSWVRASWINVNNCPTRCDYIHLLYFCKLLVLHVSSGNSTHHQEHI